MVHDDKNAFLESYLFFFKIVNCMNYRVAPSMHKICIKSRVFTFLSWFFQHSILTLVNFGGLIFKAINRTNRADEINMRSMVQIRMNSDSLYSVNEENGSFDKKIVSLWELCRIKRHLPELLVIYRGIILLNIFFQTEVIFCQSKHFLDSRNTGNHFPVRFGPYFAYWSCSIDRFIWLPWKLHHQN